MTTSRRFGSVAFAKQSAIGTPAAAPLFSCPIIDGGLGPTAEWDDLPRIGSSLARLGRFPTRKSGQGTFTMLAHPEALGLPLVQVMGAETPTGTNPTSHAITMADDYPFAMTMWSNVGRTGELGSVFSFPDAFVTRMSIEGTEGQNLVVSCDVTSFTYHPLTTMPAVSGTGSSAEDAEPRLKYIGSTVLLDPATSPAATEYDLATRVMFEVDRAPEYRQGPSLTPTVVSPDRLVNFTAGWVYDDAVGGWTWLMNFATGSSLTGTDPEQSTPDGSFDVTFGRHPALAGRYLQVESNGENWQYTMDRPDAQAQPGLLEMEAAGIVVAPSADKGGTGTSEVLVTLTNEFAGAY